MSPPKVELSQVNFGMECVIDVVLAYLKCGCWTNIVRKVHAYLVGGKRVKVLKL